MPARLVVLASGAGTTLQAILDATRAADFPAQVVAVGTDRTGIASEERARVAGVPVWTVELGAFDSRPDFDAAVADAIAAYAPDLVVLAGYMKVLGPAVVSRFRIVNTHPSLLPAFPGAHAIRDALAYGVKVAGCTVHEVDEGVDTGPILAQAAVAVEAGDDEDALRSRIQAVERVLYVDTIRALCAAMPEAAPSTAPAPVASTGATPVDPPATSEKVFP